MLQLISDFPVANVSQMILLRVKVITTTLSQPVMLKNQKKEKLIVVEENEKVFTWLQCTVDNTRN